MANAKTCDGLVEAKLISAKNKCRVCPPVAPIFIRTFTAVVDAGSEKMLDIKPVYSGEGIKSSDIGSESVVIVKEGRSTYERRDRKVLQICSAIYFHRDIG